ncbi:MAG: sulfite exporter TauE/SafE family protein [Candidatus Kerfeldbacteria bacterium]|nr:sulfite exporter TauE/SafE family protein [Candidatus Kerfeldbacteria bacterium]
MATEILAIGIVTILASLAGTVTGFGTSTIMLPILLFWMPLPETLLLVGAIHWFGNVWKLLFFREGIQWKLVLTFGLPGLLLTYLGAKLAFDLPEALLSRLLGGFLISYALYLFINPRFKIKASHLTATVGGAASGFLAGIFGVGGAVRGAVLAAFDLPKAIYIATGAVIAIMIDSVRITTYVTEGSTLTQTLWMAMLLFIPASLLGVYLGKKVVDHIPQQSFRIVVVIGLALAAIKLIIWP